MTLNNLACYFRKTGKIRVALNYLREALHFELILPNLSMQPLSETYLNLCAVFSQMDRHEEAIQHIYLSIIMMQHDLLVKTLKLFDKQSIQEKLAGLVVAYNNLAVELEYLKKDLESKKVFSVASAFAQEYLPPSHQMIKCLKKMPPQQELKLAPPRSVPQSPNHSYKEKTLLKSQYNSKEKKKIKLHQLYIPGMTQELRSLNHSKTKSVDPILSEDARGPGRLEQQQYKSLQKYLSLID